jgi:hypothetical protein
MTLRYSRPVLISGIILLLASVLAACVQVDIESEFDSDGSGSHGVALSADRTFLDEQMIGDELETALDFDLIEQRAEEDGFQFERIDTIERLGVRVWTQVDDNSDLGNVLTRLLETSGSDAFPFSATFDGGFSQSSGIGGSTYRFELTVDSQLLLESTDEELDEDFEQEIESEFDIDFGPEMLPQFIDFSYMVNMPGEVTDHNGTELGSSRVQWGLSLDGTQTFYAESEDASGFSIALIIGVAIGALALVLLIVGGIALTRPKKAPLGD